ncbi:MAG: hypothetical protein M1497_01140 [Nitrospirae bacterium]|nr:hypothetical protein [Nitrospirota bacterium]
MTEDKGRIGEMLIEAGLINRTQLGVALGEQRQWGDRLCSIIVKMGFADEESIASVLERQLGQKCVSLDDREIPAETLKRVKLDLARKYNIIPLDFEKGALTIAMSDPSDLKTIDELSFVLGTRVRPVLALESAIREAIDRLYEGKERRYRAKVICTPEGLDGMKADPDPSPPSPSRERPPAGAPARDEKVSLGMIVEALTMTLIEKGLITREELMKKIKGKKDRGT